MEMLPAHVSRCKCLQIVTNFCGKANDMLTKLELLKAVQVVLLRQDAHHHFTMRNRRWRRSSMSKPAILGRPLDIQNIVIGQRSMERRAGGQGCHRRRQ